MMKPVRSWPLALLLSVALVSCKEKPVAQVSPDSAPAPAPAPTHTLTVFAAISLTEAFGDIGKQFEAQHPDVSVKFNFAGSQQLRAQMGLGASDDVFASADQKEMTAAAAASLVDSDTVRVFAQNRLIVVFPKANPAKITALADLGRSGVKIDIGDPPVPVGKYTRDMLDLMSADPAFGSDFKDQFLANVVSHEHDDLAVLAKVRLADADAGVVYVTDVTPEAAKEVSTLAIPDPLNPVADYPIAVTASAPQTDLAKQFVAFVLSPDGQKILKQQGFLPAPHLGSSL